MRRLFLCGSAGVLLLCGCSRPSPLPPEEVMRRAALASTALQSASFTLDAELALPSPTGIRVSAELDGVIQNGGKAAQFAADLKGTLPSQTATHEFAAGVDVVAEWGRESYFSIREVKAVPEHPLFPTAALDRAKGAWWRVLSKETSIEVGPDPGLLGSQAEVVRVLRDRGLHTVHGRSAYRYDVTLDPQKLVAYLEKIAARDGRDFDSQAMLQEFSAYRATGELWIDAATFYTHKVTWDIVPADPSAGLALTLKADLTGHDAAPPVQPPATYRTFESGTFLESMLSLTGSTMPGTDAGPSVLDVWDDPAFTATGSAIPPSLLPTP